MESCFLYQRQNLLFAGAGCSVVKFLTIICILFLAFVDVSAIERAINGSNNNPDNSAAGTSGNFFLRSIPDVNFNKNGTPVNSLTDVTDFLLGNNSTTIRCTDPVPPGLYPLPRCVSDILCSYNLTNFDIVEGLIYKSFRRSSHFVTFFGEFIAADLISSKSNIPNYSAIYIPADDSSYNLNNTLGQPIESSLPVNRSQYNNGTNPLNSGYNYVTPFLDLNNIYGSTQEQGQLLREGSMGKLKTSIINGSTYPLKVNGSFYWGSRLSANVFVLAIQTIWIREHNRMCDQFSIQHPDWGDEEIFQEARRWNVGFFQKAVSEEYLGIVLGRPLPAYQAYNPNIKPGIDTFFATVTFRYGHSELSDLYQIQDESAEILASMPLNNIINNTLLELFGVETALRSIALQRQEEVDIFLATATKNAITRELGTNDLAAIDIARSRERGIPLYNVVRQYYGFPKANSFADISSNPIVQANLARTYSTVDQVEAYVGVFSEDHLDGSNLGSIMNASTAIQFSNIRDSDYFWWEGPNVFNDAEKLILRNTTFRDIIIRNIDSNNSFPQNIWTVQPQSAFNDSSTDYQGKISAWPQYVISYRIDQLSSSTIDFKVQLQTSNGLGWFGMVG